MSSLEQLKRIESSYLKSCLSSELQAVVEDSARLQIEGRKLNIYASSFAELSKLEAAYNLFDRDPYLLMYRGFPDNCPIVEIVFHCSGKFISLPIGRNIQIQGMRMPTSVVSSVSSKAIEDVNEARIIAELSTHFEKTSLPGSFSRMSDSKPYLFGGCIEKSSGLSKTSMITVPSNAPYFPSDEFDRFTRSILDAEGKAVEIHYKARRISDAVMMDRLVEARLVSFCGELWRIVKSIAPPVSML
jgi:hypothetical protein